jgi:hypothetical protein
MNILKLVNKSAISGKLNTGLLNGATRRTFSQVVSNKTAETKVRETSYGFHSMI